MNEPHVSVRARGDCALFTRPENKVERVSYPVMTPSAARRILEAIYLHLKFTRAMRDIYPPSPWVTIGMRPDELN